MQMQALLTASILNLKQLVRRCPEPQSGLAAITFTSTRLQSRHGSFSSRLLRPSGDRCRRNSSHGRPASGPRVRP
jgi:hypothetical protein